MSAAPRCDFSVTINCLSSYSLPLSSAYYQLALLLLLHERVDWTWRLCINSGPALPTPPPILIWYYQKKKKRRKKPFPHMHYSFFFCPSAVGRADAFVQFFCFSTLFAAAAELGGYISHLPNFFWLLLAILSPLAHPSSDSSVAIC